MRCVAGIIAAAALAACSQSAPQPEPAASEAAASIASPGPAAQPSPVPIPAQGQRVDPPPPEPPSTSRDPGKVVLAWAKAMSLKQWSTAYLYWGDSGARSGLTAEQFAAKWGKLANPEFELHPGKTEGAAGSLYYTAPIVLIDGKRQVRGQIVLRRANDVPGATPEQLRWHIESLTAAP